jgi:hypothetical protein
MLGFEALSALPLSALPMPAEVVVDTPVMLSGGGWVQSVTINVQWRRRQDEEWVILNG